MISRKDVEEGRISPKTIENGVVVPPGLQVNCLTLEEHRQRIAMKGLRPLTPEEEAKLHPGEAAPIETVNPNAQISERVDGATVAQRKVAETGIKLDYGDRS